MATLRSFRDQCRCGSGLIINGRTVATLGRCGCGCGGPILTRGEVDAGQCVDCCIADAEEARELAGAYSPEDEIEPGAARCGGGW